MQGTPKRELSQFQNKSCDEIAVYILLKVLLTINTIFQICRHFKWCKQCSLLNALFYGSEKISLKHHCKPIKKNICIYMSHTSMAYFYFTVPCSITALNFEIHFYNFCLRW